MKKVKFRHSAARVLFLSVSLFLSFTTIGISQDAPTAEDLDTREQAGLEEAAQEATPSGGDAAAGKDLFCSTLYVRPVIKWIMLLLVQPLEV